jgi:hypothetical protein
LTAAGLAAWVLARAGRQSEAERCGDLQEFIDTALREGERVAVSVPRELAGQAADLWDAAAELLDARTDQEAARRAAQLRKRVAALRTLLG